MDESKLEPLYPKAYKLGATVQTHLDTITVKAPRAYVWAATNEPELESTDASALAQEMAHGLVSLELDRSEDCTGEDTCECESCEAYDDQTCCELDFG